MCYALTRRVQNKARNCVCPNHQCFGQHFGHFWIGVLNIAGILLSNALPANTCCFRMHSKHMWWFIVAQIIMFFPWNVRFFPNHGRGNCGKINSTTIVPIMLHFFVCRPNFGFAPMSLWCNEWWVPLQIVDPNMLDTNCWFRPPNKTKFIFYDFLTLTTHRNFNKKM